LDAALVMDFVDRGLGGVDWFGLRVAGFKFGIVVQEGAESRDLDAFGVGVLDSISQRSCAMKYLYRLEVITSVTRIPPSCFSLAIMNINIEWSPFLECWIKIICCSILRLNASPHVLINIIHLRYLSILKCSIISFRRIMSMRVPFQFLSCCKWQFRKRSRGVYIELTHGFRSFLFWRTI